MKRAFQTFAAAAALIGATQAQTTLESAEKTFRAADKNRDGVLTDREAGSASVGGNAFRASDRDGDGNLTRDEFVVFYRDLLVKARQPVGSELDREANRINAAASNGSGGSGRGRQQQTRQTGGDAQGTGTGSAGATGSTEGAKPPTARAEAARRQLQEQRRAAAEQQQAAQGADAGAAGLEARVISAVDDLERRMQAGTLSPEDFRRMQGALVGDARRAAKDGQASGDAPATLTGTQQRLLAALAELERKAQDGESGSATELQALRQLAIQNAREAEAARKAQQGEQDSPDARAAAARAELRRREQGGQGGNDAGAQAGANEQVATDLMSALERLERRALASQATPEDYRQVRERLIVRARRAARASGVDSVEARGAQRLIAALASVQQKADQGRITQQDFATLREQMIARAREAQARRVASGAPGSSGGAASGTGAAERAPKYSRRLLLALDQLERRVLDGNSSPEDFQRLRDQFIAKAREANRLGGTTGDGMTADVAQRLQAALDELQQKTLRGDVKRADFQALRESMIGDARKSSQGATGATGANASGDSDAASGSGSQGAAGRGEPTPQQGGARRREGAGDGDPKAVEPPQQQGDAPARRGGRGGGGRRGADGGGR